MTITTNQISQISTDRFWKKVCKPNGEEGCWLWQAAKSPDGYGVVKVNKQLWAAHRLSHEMHIGPIPVGFCVCHKCDTPACVNPAHLFAGTNAENSADMKAKRRHRTPQGEAHAKAKLSADSVREIKAAIAQGQTQRQLASLYGVSQTAISLIARGKNWKCLDTQEIGS